MVEIDATDAWGFDRLKLIFDSSERWDDLFALYDRAIAAASGGRRIELLEDAAQVAKDFANRSERAIGYLEQLIALRPDARLATSLERLYERHGRHRELVWLLYTRIPQLGAREAQAARARIAGILLTSWPTRRPRSRWSRRSSRRGVTRRSTFPASSRGSSPSPRRRPKFATRWSHRPKGASARAERRCPLRRRRSAPTSDSAPPRSSRSATPKPGATQTWFASSRSSSSRSRASESGSAGTGRSRSSTRASDETPRRSSTPCHSSCSSPTSPRTDSSSLCLPSGLGGKTASRRCSSRRPKIARTTRCRIDLLDAGRSRQRRRARRRRARDRPLLPRARHPGSRRLASRRPRDASRRCSRRSSDLTSAST